MPVRQQPNGPCLVWRAFGVARRLDVGTDTSPAASFWVGQVGGTRRKGAQFDTPEEVAPTSGAPQ